MAFKPSKRRHAIVSEQELNLTPIMNLIMIIIPFLLLTAAFAKTAIIDIYLPQEGDAETDTPYDNTVQELLTITITEEGFEVGGIGEEIVIPNDENGLDFKQLTTELIKFKERYPQKEDVILLFDPHISYGTVINVMDASRETKTTEGVMQALFPMVSLGEKPIADN
ncbi:MAG: ExbD/TolR family protein [Thermodesulfobacteriota bacterium]